jgi:hypothetical protein
VASVKRNCFSNWEQTASRPLETQQDVDLLGDSLENDLLFFFFLHVHVRGGEKIRTSDLHFIRCGS